MHVRHYDPADEESVVRFSLEAWAPVFRSMQDAAGDSVFRALYIDWRAEQDQAVRDVLSSEQNTAWVGVLDAAPVGFVSATMHDDGTTEGRTGEILMLAVDPGQQGAGLGRRLTETAIDWMRDQGAKLAVVETGGDAGHAPARATYERAGFTLLPIARYFRVL